MTTFGITGASGYVGAAIAAGAERAGHNVVALSRRPTERYAWRRYELGERPVDGLLRGVDIVVHCAYDMSLTREREVMRVNVGGTRQLVEVAAGAAAKFVLISSMSAYHGTQQIYGRAKLAAELAALEAGGEAIRLGLVYGGGDEGMIGALRRLVALPVTPVIGGNAHQFMVHVEDVVRGVLTLALHSRKAGGPVGLAHPVPLRFQELLSALGAQSQTPLRPVPLPWQPVYGAMRAVEALGVPLPLRADSILGLVHPAAFVPRAELWAEIGVSLRPFQP